MSIKKSSIQDIVEKDWLHRKMQDDSVIPKKTPQQELKAIINLMSEDTQRVSQPAYLTKPIVSALKLIAKCKGTSVASLMRQVLVDYIKNTSI